MDIIILILCILNAVLLAAVLIVLLNRRGGGLEEKDLNAQTSQLKEQIGDGNKTVLDQMNRQTGTISDSVERNIKQLGENLLTEQKSTREAVSNSLNTISSEISGLRKENKESLDGINSIVTEKMQSTLNERIEHLNRTISNNFTNLGTSLREEQSKQLNIINENMQALRKENSESLDKINGTVNEKLQKTLDDRISQSFETVNKRLAEVYQSLGEMKNVAAGVTDLQKILSNVKTRGIVGEIQLSAILGEILSPEQYEEQKSVKSNSTEKVDFAIRLPGVEDGKSVFLPVDSKLPGDTYLSLANAYDSGNKDLIEEKRKILRATMKAEAKSISTKYINPPVTTEFAIMFLPFEGLYSEAVNMGLVEELQREYKVNIAGPSTMAALLNSLRMGFRTLAIQKKSGEVWSILGTVKKEFKNFSEILDKTRNNLRLADDNLEKLVGVRTRAINRQLDRIETTGDEGNIDLIDMN